MVTFYEVKHLLCKLLGQERLNDDEIVNNDDDIVFVVLLGYGKKRDRLLF